MRSLGVRYWGTSGSGGLVASPRAHSPRQIAWTNVVLPVPSSPDNPTTAGGASSRPSASPNRLRASAERRMGGADGVAVGPELEDLIAQHRGQLEIEIFGRGLHLALEQLDEGIALFGVRGPVEPGRGGLGGLRVRHARRESHLVHRLDDRAGGNPVPLVVRDLHLAPAAHLVEGALHRARDPVGVQDRPPREVPRRATDGLDETGPSAGTPPDQRRGLPPTTPRA